MTIPTLTITQLIKELKQIEVNGGEIPSVNVFSKTNPDEEGKYLGTFVCPAKIGGATIFDHTKNCAEEAGVLGNSVIPPAEIARFVLSVQAPKTLYEKRVVAMARARAIKKSRQLVGV